MRFKKILISAVAALMGMTVLTSCGERSELRLGHGEIPVGYITPTVRRCMSLTKPASP